MKIKSQSWRWQAVVLGAVLVVGLVACPPTPINPDPLLDTGPIDGTDLLISEVGSAFYRNQIAWLEVYNPTNIAINLSGYTLRSRGLDVTDGSNNGIKSFALPSVSVPARGFMVIGGKVNTDVYNTNKSVYVSNGNVVPYWFDAGFLELVKSGNSIDFVRWGDDATTPTTASAWGTANAAALPVGTDANNRPIDLGKSIVRSGNDTNNTNNWSSRNFATPAAPNDVPANAVDNDNDGIPDSAEVTGGVFGGLDLFGMGARTNQRDIFLELDNMDSTDPGLNPRKVALDKFVGAFAAKNIALHIDAGNAFSPTFDPANYNLGNVQRLLPYSQSISLSADAGLASNVYQLKSQNFDFTRNLIFYYMVLGSSQEANGSAGPSGLAEILGNDSMVTFGGWGLNTNTASNTNRLNNRMAATMMHEFGHNLNLRHGGNENVNNKPNYVSIMNYLYQLECIGPVTGAGTGDRYSYNRGFIGFSDMVNNAASTNCLIDYSNGSSTGLNENSLNENAGIGRGNSSIEWNNNGTIETSLSFNINPLPQGDNTKTTLTDFDDWSNIRIGFARMQQTYVNSAQLHEHHQVVPFSNDRQEIYPEPRPSSEFFKRLAAEK